MSLSKFTTIHLDLQFFFQLHSIHGDPEAYVFYCRQRCVMSMSQPWWQSISHGKVGMISVFCEMNIKLYKAEKTSENHSERLGSGGIFGFVCMQVFLVLFTGKTFAWLGKHSRGANIKKKTR